MIPSGNGIVPDFLADAKQPEQVKASITAPASNDNGKPYVPKTDKQATIKERLSVWIMGGVVGLLLILFVASRISPRPHAQSGSPLDANKNAAQASQTAPANGSSILPITDAGHPQADTNDKSNLAGEDIARTAKQRSQTSMQPSTASNLGGIAPFNNQQQPWEAAPFQPNAAQEASEQPTGVAETRNERDGLDKPSLVFVRNTATALGGSKTQDSSADIDPGVGLPPGTRLRARLESAVSTAVSTPVIAVVEYNYERHGEIMVPAGARVFGHLEAADASGYVGVRFESVLMPDGSSVNLDAAATDMRLRPLRGKVEGRHRGKNILVRSASGIGEVAATLAGRGSLNQPLSEGDLLRERVSNNIAQASDEEVNKLAVTAHLVVSVPADTEIYIVLQKATKGAPVLKSDGASSTSPANSRQSAEQLRQLLQLQKELSQESSLVNSSQ